MSTPSPGALRAAEAIVRKQRYANLRVETLTLIIDRDSGLAQAVAALEDINDLIGKGDYYKTGPDGGGPVVVFAEADHTAIEDAIGTALAVVRGEEGGET